MTLIDIKREAEDRVFALILQINRYTKRGKPVPADLLAAFGAAYKAQQTALAALLNTL